MFQLFSHYRDENKTLIIPSLRRYSYLHTFGGQGWGRRGVELWSDVVSGVITTLLSDNAAPVYLQTIRLVELNSAENSLLCRLLV